METNPSVSLFCFLAHKPWKQIPKDYADESTLRIPLTAQQSF